MPTREGNSMSTYAVIGTSPFHDVTVAIGPFRSVESASRADDELAAKGWNTELVTLENVNDIDVVTNDEGSSD